MGNVDNKVHVETTVGKKKQRNNSNMDLGFSHTKMEHEQFSISCIDIHNPNKEALTFTRIALNRKQVERMVKFFSKILIETNF